MSTMSYLAGVAAETHINEAIRAEETRAHGAQLRAIERNHQTTLDQFKDLHNSYAASVEVVLENNKERYENLMQKNRELLKFSQDVVEKLAFYVKTHQEDTEMIKTLVKASNEFYDDICVYQANAHVRGLEVENFFTTIIPKVVDFLFHQMGKEPDPAVRKEVIDFLFFALPTADPAFREKFSNRIRAEILEAKKRNERYQVNEKQLAKIGDIAEELANARQRPGV